jgi:hypothetical protein
LTGLSISAEYQHEVTMPSASSPMFLSTASSSAVMPPIGVTFFSRPYSFIWRTKRKPFEPAKPRKIASTLVLSCAR